MRFSIFTVADHHPGLPRGIGALYGQLIDHAVLAEELGYDAYFVAEHHFHEYGAVANPAVLLAAIAQRTTRLRLGPAIAVLPFRNPLTVAEDYAILDQLSGGRCVMGVGSGYLAHEFAGFRIDGKEKRERFDEALAVLRLAWSGGKVDFRGRHVTVEGVAINVQPLQQPHPPLYVAVLRAEGAYHVGRQGNRMMTVPYASVDDLAQIGPMLASYDAGLAEAGAPAADTLTAFHTHVAESDAAARAAAAEVFDLYVATRLYARRQTYDDILRSRLGLFGSVGTVVERLLALHAMGVRHVLTLQDFGALAPEAVQRSMTLFATEVMPRVAARIAATAAA